MGAHRSRILFTTLLILMTSLGGCAQQKYAMRDASEAESLGIGTLQALRVSPDASQVDVVANKPLVYTYYKTSDPPRIVLDLAQTSPGAVKGIEVNQGNVGKVTVEKHDVGLGTLSRVQINMLKEADFSVAVDQNDKGMLHIAFAPTPEKTATVAEAASPKAGEQPPKPEGAVAEAKPQQPAAPEAAPAAAPAPAEVAASAPPVAAPMSAAGSPQAQVQGEGQSRDSRPAAPEAVAVQPAGKEPAADAASQALKPKILGAVNVTPEGIDLVVQGGVEKTEAFVLQGAKARLVVDLYGVKNGLPAKTVNVGAFDVTKARLGTSADKVRVVFDGAKDKIHYRIVRRENGLSILLGENAEKAAIPEPAGSAAAPTAASSAGGDSATASRPGAEPGDKTLTAVNVAGDGIDLVVKGDFASYKAFMLDKPERLTVDLIDVKSSLGTRTIEVNAFGIDHARLNTTADKTRVVFDSAGKSFPAYQIVKNDQGLKIVFGKPGEKPAKPAAAEAVAPVPQVAPASAPAKVKTGAAVVEGIDFKVMDGFSRIAIRTGGACTPGTPAKVKEGLSLTVKGCQLPKKLQRMLDTRSFASVVRNVTPYSVRTRDGYDSRFLVRLRAEAPSTLKQEEGVLFWDIRNTQVPPAPVATAAQAPALREGAGPGKAQPAPKAEAAPAAAEETDLLAKLAEPPAPRPQTTVVKPEQKRYTGRKVTLEFSDADVRKIFQLIAEVSNLNFLIADDVSGTISLKLVNVPWDQALDVILESKNLEMKREGNIVQIKPRGRFKTQEQEEGEARRIREKQMELQTAVIDINYATVGEIVPQLDKLKSQHDNVSVSPDPRTNRVIITDIGPSVEKMRELIKTLDVPEKQVMIEARIVEASTSFAKDMGVQWNLKYTDPTSSIAGINNLASSFGGVVSNVLPSGNTGGVATGVSFGKLGSNIQLDLRLSAAATTGLIKIISTPKVVTLNNKAAKISQGQSIPYQTVSAEGTRTEFVEAALTLEVTPHITSDGSIVMKIRASNNSPGAGTPPPINKKEATTELQLKNGETTVIGGIYVDSDTESDTGVPFLKDIPLLGYLFKSSSQSKIKTELLIFITPRIVG